MQSRVQTILAKRASAYNGQMCSQEDTEPQGSANEKITESERSAENGKLR